MSNKENIPWYIASVIVITAAVLLIVICIYPALHTTNIVIEGKVTNVEVILTDDYDIDYFLVTFDDMNNYRNTYKISSFLGMINK